MLVVCISFVFASIPSPQVLAKCDGIQLRWRHSSFALVGSALLDGTYAAPSCGVHHNDIQVFLMQSDALAFAHACVPLMHLNAQIL